MNYYLIVAMTAFIVVLLTAIFIKYFRKYFPAVLENILLDGGHMPDLVVRRVTNILIEETDISLLVSRLLQLLRAEFRVSGVAIMFFGPYLKRTWKTDGFSGEPPTEMVEEGSIHRVLLGRVCIFDELPEGELRSFFQKNGFTATFPIKIKSQPIAILILGVRERGAVFDRGEVELIGLIVSEIGIGMQNAIAFTGIKQFNQELEHNVSERTDALIQAQKNEIEKSNEVARLKDEFVFLASHELRNPITEIRRSLKSMLDVKGKFPKDIEENLKAMQLANDHLDHLVGDLLVVAWNGSDALLLKMERNDLRAILLRVLSELRPSMIEKDIALHEDLKDIPDVLCDETKIREVFLHLIGNAIEYGKEKGNIFVSAYRIPGEKFVIFEIMDDGLGMQTVLQKKIFQKFFHSATPWTEDMSGKGLGLFVTRMLVEKMGGKIMFTSNEHKGTTFSFTLPLAT